MPARLSNLAPGNSGAVPREPDGRIADEQGRPLSDDEERPAAEDDEDGDVDVDAPGRSLIDENVDAVEPNEPG